MYLAATLARYPGVSNFLRAAALLLRLSEDYIGFLMALEKARLRAERAAVRLRAGKCPFPARWRAALVFRLRCWESRPRADGSGRGTPGRRLRAGAPSTGAVGPGLPQSGQGLAGHLKDPAVFSKEAWILLQGPAF